MSVQLSEIRLESLPKTLLHTTAWIPWKAVTRDNGKVGKVPWDVINGTPLKDWTNQSRLLDADKALQVAKEHQCAGIGLVLRYVDYTAIDIDDCFDAAGDLKDPRAVQTALQWMEAGAYVEYSVSRTGLHILAQGDVPVKQRGVDRRITNGFVTFTGLQLCKMDLLEYTTDLKEVAEVVLVHEKPKMPVFLIPQADGPRPDEQVIYDLLNTYSKNKLARSLWENQYDTAVYASHSAADFALLYCILEVMGVLDPEQLERIYRQSALCDLDYIDIQNPTYLSRTITNALAFAHKRQEHRAASSLEMTDVGNASLLVETYATEFRFIPESGFGKGDWYHWSGQRWELDRNLIHTKATTIHTFWWDRANAPGIDTELKKQYAKWSFTSAMAERIKAMVNLASTHQEINVQREELDNKPDFLNIRNGTLHVPSGTLHPHDRGDMLTKLAGKVNFDTAATCPRFDAFMDWAFAGDTELIAYVWRLIGYSLTGRANQQMFAFLYGAGKNGKTTFTNIWKELLGFREYCSMPDIASVQAGLSVSEHDKARLPFYGARLAIVGEITEGMSLDEGFVKSLAGQDAISGRRLYKEYFNYVPQCLLVLYGNYRPRIRGTDKGIWRRVHLIPMTQTRDTDDNPNFANEIIETELPGILNRAIAGCQDFIARGGLEAPAAVRAEVDAYRASQDEFGIWLHNHFEVGPKDKSDTNYGMLFSRFVLRHNQTSRRAKSEAALLDILSKRTECFLELDSRYNTYVVWGLKELPAPPARIVQRGAKK